VLAWPESEDVPNVLKLANTRRGVLVERSGRWMPVAGQSWDALVTRDDLPEFLAQLDGETAGASTRPRRTTCSRRSGHRRSGRRA
jgi:hypothetical protein